MNAMPRAPFVGWDLGGAHVKAACVNSDGTVRHVIQRPCALWRGLEQLSTTVKSILEDMQVEKIAAHAVTMTGELADVFTNRAQGVRQILNLTTHQFASAPVLVYAGRKGFVTSEVAAHNTEHVASSNWLAAATLTTARLPEGLFIDIGSTTTDMVILTGGGVQARGHSDHQRLACEELIYTGVVRTPVMVVTDKIALSGAWISVIAETFATTADVYRLTCDLPQYADMLPSADEGDKSNAASTRRLARMVGRDSQSAEDSQWRRVADYVVERQLARLRAACEVNLSRELLTPQAPLVGAGVGRFLVRALAIRLQRPFVDFGALFPLEPIQGGVAIADCAPAVAVALLVGPHLAERIDENAQGN